MKHRFQCPVKEKTESLKKQTSQTYMWLYSCSHKQNLYEQSRPIKWPIRAKAPQEYISL